MAKNKKPKKAYVRGKVLAGGHLPIPKRRADSMETKALMALAALKGGFFTQDMGLDLSIFLTACSKFDPGSDDPWKEGLISAMRAMSGIANRHTATGKWGASGDELSTLSAQLPMLVEVYKSATRSEVAGAMSAAETKYLRTLDKLR